MNEEEVWQSDSEWIKRELGANITKRRIGKISFIHNGKVLTAEVGRPNPYNGYPLRAIYEDAARATFILCGGSLTMAPKDSLVEEY